MKVKKLILDSKIPRKVYKELEDAIASLEKFNNDGLREMYFSEDQTKRRIIDLKRLIRNYDSELRYLNGRKERLIRIMNNSEEVSETRRLETIKSLKREIAQLSYFLKNGKRKIYKNIENSYYYSYTCNFCNHKEFGTIAPSWVKCSKCNSRIDYEGRLPKDWKPWSSPF